jgi:hypothetical protein
MTLMMVWYGMKVILLDIEDCIVQLMIFVDRYDDDQMYHVIYCPYYHSLLSLLWMMKCSYDCSLKWLSVAVVDEPALLQGMLLYQLLALAIHYTKP